jgi:hypothetical protein
MVVFEIFGDSNVARSWKSVASESDRLKGSVLRSATSLVMLKDSLRTVSQTTKFIIVSALSNPVSRIAYDGNEVTLRTDLGCIYDEILDCLVQTLNCNTELQVCSYVYYFTSSVIVVVVSQRKPKYRISSACKNTYCISLKES